MHDQAQFVAFKINPVITQPKAVQRPAGPLEPAKSLQISAHHFLRQAAKLPQDVQLQFLRHVRQFRRARRIKYDLEWTHRFWPPSAKGGPVSDSSASDRTRIEPG